MKLLNISPCVCAGVFMCVCVYVCVPSGPLEDGLEEEEEECVSEENELLAKDEFSAEENLTAEFESENMNCEEMEYFCNKGEGWMLNIVWRKICCRAKQKKFAQSLTNNFRLPTQSSPGRACRHLRIVPASTPRVLMYDSSNPPKSSGLILEKDGPFNCDSAV